MIHMFFPLIKGVYVLSFPSGKECLPSNMNTKYEKCENYALLSRGYEKILL
jgi:hypothetical protein